MGLPNITNAQEIIRPLITGLPEANDTGNIYYKDTTNSLDKYLETWLYDDGTTYFKITFIKKEHSLISNRTVNVFRDELVCEYLLKVNDITIYDTYGANSNATESIANHILGSLILEENKVNLFYSEPPLNGGCERYASGKLELEYENNPFMTAPQLQWTRINDVTYGDTIDCTDGTQKDTSDFKIPANMTLIKQ